MVDYSKWNKIEVSKVILLLVLYNKKYLIIYNKQ